MNGPPITWWLFQLISHSYESVLLLPVSIHPTPPHPPGGREIQVDQRPCGISPLVWLPDQKLKEKMEEALVSLLLLLLEWRRKEEMEEE